MADVKWIKITTDIFDDEKILLIESMPDPYAIITVWFKLLCLAGKQNNSGVFMMGQMAYTDKMLATIFRMNESTVTMALSVFEQFGMVEIIDGVITIPNWDKHQSLDKLEQAREKTRERVAAHRERQKALASCNGYSNVTVTQCNATDKDIDIDKDKEINKEDKPKRTRFAPPTLDDVKAYCLERKNRVDPERFINHYEANGWMVGKNKMKDWKAAIRTWERNEYSSPKSENKTYDTESRFNAAVNRTKRAQLEREVVERFEQNAQKPLPTEEERAALQERMRKLQESFQ